MLDEGVDGLTNDDYGPQCPQCGADSLKKGREQKEVNGELVWYRKYICTNHKFWHEFSEREDQ
jgi:hypothetical protein